MSTDDPRIDDDTTTATPSRRGHGDGVSRRRLMAAGAAGWATVSLAGCTKSSGGGDDGGNTGGDETDGETTDYTVTSTTTTTTAPAGTTSTEESSDGGGGATTTTECTQSSIFAPGMDIGFLVSVYDQLSGALLGDDELATVTIAFPDADFEPIELSPSGPHEAHVTDKWGGKLSAPVDAEPGTYKYEIRVGDGPDAEPTLIVVDELTLVELSP